MSTSLAVRSGPWDDAVVRDWLARTVVPIRLATSGREFPLVQSLWFLLDDDALWCCTQADSVLARRLAREPRCGFEVSPDAPPYRGVRGTGRAVLDPGAAASVLPRLIDRYLGPTPGPLAEWLLSRLDREVAIRIDGLALTSWDYSARMTPASH